MSREQGRKDVRLTVRIPADVAGALRALAQEHTRSVNGEIVHALRAYVSEQRGPHKD